MEGTSHEKIAEEIIDIVKRKTGRKTNIKYEVSSSSSFPPILLLFLPLSFDPLSLLRGSLHIEGRWNSLYFNTPPAPRTACTPNVCCSPPPGHVAFQSSVCEGTANKLVASSRLTKLNIACSLLHNLYMYILTDCVPVACIYKYTQFLASSYISL